MNRKEALAALIERLETAIAAHKAALPNGDFTHVNAEFSRIWFAAKPFIERAGFDPWAYGNEGRLAILKDLHAMEPEDNA